MVSDGKLAKLELKNKIVIHTYKQVFLTLEIAKRCVAERVQFQNGKEYPVLCDMRNILLSQEQARNYLAGIGSTAVKALALLTDSFTEPMAKIYLDSYPQSIPTGIFSNEEEALDFLEQYK